MKSHPRGNRGDGQRGSKDYSEFPPPPPELMGEHNQSNGKQQISYNNQVTYGVVCKGKRNEPDSSFNNPPLNRSPMKGPLAPAPEEFVKNLHRVMEKKWKVAQTLSGDFSEDQILTSFHPQSSPNQDQFVSNQVMGFRDSSFPPAPPSHHEQLPPPPPSHYQQPNGHQGLINSSSHIPAPPALTCLQPIQYQNHGFQQQQKFPPPPPSRTDTSFYDVLPISVRPFNREINHVGSYESGNSVNGCNGHPFQSGPQQNLSPSDSQSGINHRNHPGSGSPSSAGLFGRMNPFRRSSKVSSVCSSNSSNYSSSSGGSKGAPPPPPKRSDKTKLSHLKT